MSTSEIFRPGLLDGQVVLLSGGGTGLGRATAIELSSLGARVVICGRKQEPLDETVSLCPDGLCIARTCDIREEDQVDALVDWVVAEHGQIDVLVNNAGGQYMTPAEAITPKGFRTVVGLNLVGTWLMTHAVATKAMIPSGQGGKIISVTLSPHDGLPAMAHSSAARAGVENLMKVLSIEWARFNIRTTALAAGHFRTDALKKYPPQVQEGVAKTVPIGRLGEAEEHAWLVAYLCSPAGDYYSGTVLTLDGARDNWYGPWPPPAMQEEDGRPPTEARKPKSA
jgi:citronellol/citronellal dehydrogenase